MFVEWMSEQHLMVRAVGGPMPDVILGFCLPRCCLRALGFSSPTWTQARPLEQDTPRIGKLLVVAKGTFPTGASIYSLEEIAWRTDSGASKICSGLGVILEAYNPSIWKAESRVQGQSGLHSKLNSRPFPNKKRSVTVCGGLKRMTPKSYIWMFGSLWWAI